MDDIQSINGLADNYKKALSWFHDYQGKIVGFPEKLDGEIYLATRAKGIYKPESSNYALSIRQTLSSPYPDQSPIYRDDKSWIYVYHQEGDDPRTRDDYFTNRALIAAGADKIPVGVMIQIAISPSRYLVLGLAYVVGWEDGYFILEGLSSKDKYFSGSQQSRQTGEAASEYPVFDINNLRDTREKIIVSMIKRQGQPNFRKKLLIRYSGKCVISGCDVENALDAAHIIPFHGKEYDHPENGLLLRSDIHNLFDLGLIAIDERSIQVIVSHSLSNSQYNKFHGQKLYLPNDKNLWPSKEALRSHREWAKL